MPTLRVSNHAVIRYQERVAPVSAQEARAILSAPGIQAAANFGALCVRLGTGQRVVIEDGVIVTVLPTGTWPGTLDPRRRLERKPDMCYNRTHARRHVVSVPDQQDVRANVRSASPLVRTAKAGER